MAYVEAKPVKVIAPGDKVFGAQPVVIVALGAPFYDAQPVVLTNGAGQVLAPSAFTYSNNGDGTYSVTGAGTNVVDNGNGTFTLTS